MVLHYTPRDAIQTNHHEFLSPDVPAHLGLGQFFFFFFWSFHTERLPRWFPECYVEDKATINLGTAKVFPQNTV